LHCFEFAGVVPLHGKDALPVNDDKLTLTNQKGAYEYDGLVAGELAWVLGRQFPTNNKYYGSHLQYAGLVSMPMSPPDALGGSELNPAFNGVIPHLNPVGSGIGYGVDRLQRLAYTNWIEAHFKHRVGTQEIDLKEFDMFGDVPKKLSSLLDYWSTRGAAGSDMFAVPDLAYAMQKIQGNASTVEELAVSAPMMQGLFVMERGPFLRSIGTDNRPIDLHVDDKVHAVSAPRHLGSRIAQAGLEACLKQNGVFNWIPDGICMSKYETGPDGIADTQFDAQMSQLFNVAVQGSAITKTWTGDDRLVCMPTDKVFILVVGTLHYTLADDADTTAPSAKRTKDLADALWKEDTKQKPFSQNMLDDKLLEDVITGIINSKKAGGDAAKFKAWIGQAGAEWDKNLMTEDDMSKVKPDANTFRDGIMGYRQALANKDGPDNVKKYKARAEYLWNEYKVTTATKSDLVNELLGKFDKTAAKVRNGSKGVSSAVLTNLRLMRATSSFLTANSHYKTNENERNKNSRLGLGITFNSADGGKGVADYVLGGWCIGTVLDSAASRTMSGSVVRVSAASMALNINVNVEWWNADKLYQHYQDKERYTKPPLVQADKANKKGNIKSEVDVETIGEVPANDAKLSVPKGTMSQRDVPIDQPSVVYSPDYDEEKFPDASRTYAPHKEFSRRWAGAVHS
jgi:hypothetical protein